MLNQAIKYLNRKQTRFLRFLKCSPYFSWGVLYTPLLGWDTGIYLPIRCSRCIPDIGGKSTDVFTKWQGRSPAGIIEDKLLSLTTSLIGILGVKTMSYFFMFGFSSDLYHF